MGVSGEQLVIDLGAPSGAAIVVDAEGWALAHDHGAAFLRPQGQKSLPEPASGGSVEELADFIHFKSEGDQVRATAWLLGCYQPGGPFPILTIHDPILSAGVHAAAILASLIDPQRRIPRSRPVDTRDFAIHAKPSFVLVYSVDTLPRWLIDALCSAATCGTFATRALYSDDEEIAFDCQRPIILVAGTRCQIGKIFVIALSRLR